MSLFVVDASVAMKWVIQEPGTDDALTLRLARLIAPELIIPECANVLWKAHRRGEFSFDEALYAAQLLTGADVELWPMRGLLEPATRLAIELEHPAYDCIYLALAAAQGCDLVTADDRLRTKAGFKPGLPAVRSIAEAAKLAATP